ncbi:MAG: T9SS type A sorting domain-containing protein [Bacteroidetes bacterium]|nr:T9SS type A sorting domain-containing protein [Bacteroidota bacterium]
MSDGNQTRHDTVQLNIIPALEASAGNDTTVCWFVSPIPLYGTAINYSKIVWGTGGDGSFSNSASLTTNYFPGIHDKTTGFVDLVLLAIPLPPCVPNIVSTKHVVLDPCTGIRELPNNGLSVVVQPNPAQDKVLITITGLQRAGELTITGLEGREVCSRKIDPAGNQNVTQHLDVSSFPKGIYILKLLSEDKISITRFLVQ